MLRRLRRSRRHEYGFSLVEISISLLVTLIVLALVFQTTRASLVIYRKEIRSIELSSLATRALDDMTIELARSGYGLGDRIDRVLASVPGKDTSAGQITVRSNPDGVSANLIEASGTEASVAISGAKRFRPGDLVLLTDLEGSSERAEITRVDSAQLTFRSLDSPDGDLLRVYSAYRGARILKLREVHYYLGPAEEGNGYVLVKDIPSTARRILARGLDELLFEYFDAYGNELSPASLYTTERLALVRITMRFSVGPAPSDRKFLRTAVAFGAQSATIDFAERGYGFRLARYFYPIESPAGLVTRPFADWGVILASGQNPIQDPAYLYTFLTQKRFLEGRVESLTWLPEIRGPVALCFGPERSPVAGSVFVASSGLRIGQLSRVWPDAYGVLSPESQVSVFEKSDALAQIGGIAFGADGALYITSKEKGQIFRYRFDEAGKPDGPELVATLKGSPGAIAAAADGALYFLLSGDRSHAVWRLPLGKTLSAGEPSEIAQLPGEGLSLALDPVSENLFVLVREPLGDTVVLELSQQRPRGAEAELHRAFSLADFREEMMEGPSRRRSTSRGEIPSLVVSLRLPPGLLPEELDFLAFDAADMLYLGASEKDLVLKFDLDRSDPRHAVGIAGVVEDVPEGTIASPRVRLHAWKKSFLGL